MIIGKSLQLYVAGKGNLVSPQLVCAPWGETGLEKITVSKTNRKYFNVLCYLIDSLTNMWVIRVEQKVMNRKICGFLYQTSETFHQLKNIYITNIKVIN